VGASISAGNVNSSNQNDQKSKQSKQMSYEHSDSRKPPHNPHVRDSQNIVKQKPKTSDLRANSEVGKETHPRPVTATI